MLPELTYLITTRNKLESLRCALGNLVDAAGDSDEIVVVDGGSTDGTPDYLGDLRDRGKIHQVLSEPDAGEAHALNKGLLMARGQLVTVVTDDDAFRYQELVSCKAFMLSHPDIDLLGSQGGLLDFSLNHPIRATSDGSAYREWRETGRPFAACGLGLLLRRSAVPLLGLFHTGVMRVDNEFVLRATAGPARIAWYTGYTYVRFLNARSNSVREYDRFVEEGERLNQFYVPPRSAGRFRHAVSLLKRAVQVLSGPSRSVRMDRECPPFEQVDWPRLLAKCERWLATQNERQPGTFLMRDSASDPMLVCVRG